MSNTRHVRGKISKYKKGIFMKNFGKLSRTLLSLLLTIVMLLSTVLPAAAQTVEGADDLPVLTGGSTGSADSTDSNDEGGTLDIGWCEIDYDKGGLKVTFYPDIDALLGTGKADIGNIVDTLVSAIKLIVLDTIGENFGTEEDSWSNVLDSYVKNDENYDEGGSTHTLMEEMIKGDDEKIFESVSSYVSDILGIAAAFGYVELSKLPDASEIKDKVMDTFHSYLDSYVAENGSAEIEEHFGMTTEEISDRVESFADVFADDYEKTVEKVESENAELGIRSILEALKSVKVDGNTVFENSTFNLDGMKALIKALPTFTEISGWDNGEMQLSWAVEVCTGFGDSSFNLTVALGGGYDEVRAIAKVIAEHIDISYDGGKLTLDVSVPDAFARVLRRACDSTSLSPELKEKIFTKLDSDVGDLYALYQDLNFNEIIELLGEIDFEGLLDEDAIGQYIDLSKYSNDDIVNKVKQFESLFNKLNSKLSALVAKVYNKIPDQYKSMSLMDLYRGEGLFTLDGSFSVTVAELERELTELAPDEYKDMVPLLLSFFDLDEISLSLDASVKFENVAKIEYYVGDDTEPYRVGLLPAGATVADFAGITSYQGRKILGWVDEDGNPVDKMTSADTKAYAKLEIKALVTLLGGDNNPAVDITEVYDAGIEYVLKVSVKDLLKDNSATLSADGYESIGYQWYRNGEKMVGATLESISLANVADSGTYCCEVTISDSYNEVAYTTSSVNITVTPKPVGFGSVAWGELEFLYDNGEHVVEISGVDQTLFDIAYSDNAKTDVGSYTATVTVSFKDSVIAENYVIENNTFFELLNGSYVATTEWEILRGRIVLSELKWAYYDLDGNLVLFTGDENFVYTYDFEKGEATEYEVALVRVNGDGSLELMPTDLVIAYDGTLSATDAGTYSAEVEAIDGSAALYDIIGTVDDIQKLDWSISPRSIDVGDIWNYDSALPFGKLYNVVNGDFEYLEIFDVTGNYAESAPDSYTAVATLKAEYSNNYVISNPEAATLNWEISPVGAGVVIFKDGNTVLSRLDNVTYDENKTYTLEAVLGTAPAGTVVTAYQWYKDGAPINGATESTLSVKNVADNGIYYCVMTVKSGDGISTTTQTEEADVKIYAKVTLSASSTSISHVYNGNPDSVTVTLNGLTEGAVSVDTIHIWKKYVNGSWRTQNIDGNTLTVVNVSDSGRYRYEVTVTQGANVQTVNVEISVNITPLTVNVDDFVWDDLQENNYTYNGNVKRPHLENNNIPAYVEVSYSNPLQGKVPGTYKTTAYFELVGESAENYELSAASREIGFTIAKASFDHSQIHWNYDGEIIYNGATHRVELVGFEDFTFGDVKAIYTGVTSASEPDRYTVTFVKFVVMDGGVERDLSIYYNETGLDNIPYATTLAWVINKEEAPPPPPPPPKTEHTSSDGAIKITDSDAFLADYSMNVNEADIGEKITFPDGTVMTVIKAYNIVFKNTDNELPIYTDGLSFGVEIVIPEGYLDRDIYVVYYDESGEEQHERLSDAVKADGAMSFDVSHFSIYALATVDEATPTGDEGVPPWVWILIGVLLVLLIALVIVLIVRKNKRGGDTTLYSASESDGDVDATNISIVEAPIAEVNEPVAEAVIEEAAIEEAVVEEAVVEEAVVEEAVVEEAVVEEPVVEEAVVEEPVVEEAVVEEPVVEEAVVEEAVVEEAVVEEPVVEEAIVEAPIAEVEEEAVVEEPVVEEAVVEEAVVEEAVVEEPVVEEAAPVVVPTPAIASDEDDGAAQRIVDGQVVLVRYRSSFMSRYIQSESDIQDYYGILKNTLLSYKGVKARTSWNCESFNKGRIQCAKINIKGRALIVYLGLDPKDYSESKYHFTDVSDKPKFAKVPMMIKVRSDRALKYALELIVEMMSKLGIEQTEQKNVDYRMPYETTEALVAKDLIKVILPAGMTLDENANIVKVDVGEMLENAKAEAENAGVEAVVEEPVVEEPVVEEPVVEEPVVEEPVVEEAVVEEPVVEEPVVEEAVVEEPVVEETVVEEAVVEEVVAEETVHVDAQHADELVTDEEAAASIEVVKRTLSKSGGKMCEINLDTICENFEDGETVTLAELKKRRLVSASAGRVKVLARGIMDKKLTVIADKFSLQAVKMITLAGGLAEQEK